MNGRLLRIVLFGSGSPLSIAAFDVLRRHDVAAVVVPGGPPIRGPRAILRRLGRRRALSLLLERARALSVPVIVDRPGDTAPLKAALLEHAPDLLCVASYPRLLAAPVLCCARSGAIGLHPSLLPRHRGADALFWTYLQDDTEAGMSVYWLDESADGGDVIAQRAIPLARGRAVADLYDELAQVGAELLGEAVQAIARGQGVRATQDGSRATYAPPAPPDWGLDFARWDCERVWHVLSGLAATGSWRGPDGRARRLGAVAFRPEAHGRAPGTIESKARGWRVFCRDGVVEASRARVSVADGLVDFGRRFL